MAEDESFVRRWSRLKTSVQDKQRDVQAGEADQRPVEEIVAEPRAAPRAPLPADDDLAAEVAEAPPLEGEDLAADAAAAPQAPLQSGEDLPEQAAGAPQRVAIEDLPDIDSLSLESDFTVFLGDGVPDSLRNAALRRLWRLDPVFANLDGLVDYGGDYTDAATVVENLKTSYRVGFGFLDDADERTAPAALREERTAAGSAVQATTTPGSTSESTPAGATAAPHIDEAKADAGNPPDGPACSGRDATRPEDVRDRAGDGDGGVEEA